MRAAVSARGVRDLTEGPVVPALISFALPTLASSILQSLGGSVNTIWVGRFLGEQALAATINGNMVSFLLMALVFGTGMSATILVGKAVGGRNLDLARRIMGTAIGAFSAVSVLVAALGWLATPSILGLLGAPVGAADLAEDYLRMTFLGLPAALLFSLLMMGLRGLGDSLSPLWFTVCFVLIDVALNPIFILGLGPAPALGIAGSALALTLANGISLLAMVIWIYRRDLAIRLSPSELHYLLPDRTLLAEIVRKGLPMGLQMIILTVSAMGVLSLVNAEGVLTTAAYGVVQQLWGYLQMPAMAVAAAVSALTAQAIGANIWSRVRHIAQCGVVLSLSLTVVMILALLCIDHLVVGIFLHRGSPAGPIAEHILWSTCWGFALFSVTSVLFGSLRADGVVTRPLLISIVSMFGIRLSVAFGAHGWLGADSLWLSLTAGQIATLVLATMLYRSEGAKRRRPMEARQNAEALSVEDVTVG